MQQWMTNGPGKWAVQLKQDWVVAEKKRRLQEMEYECRLMVFSEPVEDQMAKLLVESKILMDERKKYLVELATKDEEYRKLHDDFSRLKNMFLAQCQKTSAVELERDTLRKVNAPLLGDIQYLKSENQDLNRRVKLQETINRRLSTQPRDSRKEIK